MQAVGSRLSVQLVRLQYHLRVEIPTPLLLAQFRWSLSSSGRTPGVCLGNMGSIPVWLPFNNIEVVYGKDVLALT